jgi:pimeloyl-ACP methyl ester carboxylesterase
MDRTPKACCELIRASCQRGWIAAMTRETFEAPVPGVVLAGTVEGDGPPVIVLHGGPGLSVDVVDGLVADLVPSYRVAVFQQRGLAPSATDGAFTIDEAVSDVVAVLDHLGWGRAYVVGSSWGGHLVLWCAALVPQRLLGALAVDPLGAVGDGGNAEFEAAMSDRTPEADRLRAAELDRLAQEGEVSEELAMESLQLFWPAYFAVRETAPPMWASRLSIRAYSGLFADLLARMPELEALLPSIGLPVGAVVGAVSPMPVSAARQSTDLVPGGWTQVVPGAGHFPWYEAPGSVRQALDRLARDADHSSASSA